jgi:type I restriction enzyme S subunit
MGVDTMKSDVGKIWDYVNLNDVCRPRQWKTLSMDLLLPHGFPVYGANGRIGFYSEYTHELPTLSITCRGATCGNVHITEPKSYINGNAMALDNMSDEINIRYLYYYLKQRGFNDVISGSAQPQITREGLNNIFIPLPPLAIQKRIAEILDAADALRRKDQELLKKYDELAQAIFIDMFGDPVKNEMGWEVKTIKSTTNIITYGLTVRPKYIENGFPLISARELRNGFVNFRGAPKISQADFSKLSNKCKPQKSDILFSKTGSIGLSAIVDGSQEFAITQNAARINFKNEFYETYFIYSLLKQDSFINKCVSLVKGNAVKDLQLGDFSKIEIICPPITKQIKFSEMSQKTNELIKNSKNNSIVSDHLFNSLLQKAFKGELIS